MMNSLRQPSQLTVCPLSTPGWSLEEDLALADTLGLRRVGVSLSKLDATEGGAAAGVRQIARAGLEVDVLYPSVGADLAHPKSWAPAQDEAARALGIAGDLSATGMLVGAGARGMGFEEAVDAMAALVEPLRDTAATTGVRLLIEPVRTQFAYAGFVHSLRDGLMVAERLDVGLVVDITHCWWEPSLAATLGAAVGRILTVHLGDLRLDRPVVERVVPGDGDLRIGSFVATLLDAGYEGPFEIEIMGTAIDHEGVGAALARSVAALSSVWPDHTGCSDADAGPRRPGPPRPPHAAAAPHPRGQ